jgi:hypothetical protein
MEQTELVVVNALLRIVGESPVNEIDLGHPDIVAALGIWDEYSLEEQSHVWWYNKETWQLIAGTDDKVVIPTNVIAIDGPEPNYIKKGRYLYDLENHTYDFSTATAADLKLDLIMDWTMDQLPPVMFNYILAKAKLNMLVDYAYDKNKEAKLEKEVTLRQYLVQKHNLRFTDPNAKQTITAQQLLLRQPTR